MAGEREAREAALTELRERLADGLARKGLQKSQLAGRTALSRTTVQQAFRHGGQVPTAATIAKLANELNLPVNELLELRRAAADAARPTPSADAARPTPSADAARPMPSAEDGPGKPIGQWDPHDLEVHPARTTTVTTRSGARSQQELPGYVRRAHDQVLAEAVGDAAAGRSRMLVLVGSSSTGKTRACWEAVQPLADRGWRLWHPHDPTRAEAALAGLRRVAPRTVVWLNEAQHYLGHPRFGERIAAALHTLLTDSDHGPVLVLGTLWPEYANTYVLVPKASGPDPRSRVRELLAGRTVPVADTFDQEALQAATALAQGGDQLLADALTRAQGHGRVTQDLAGAPELLRRYEHGTPPVRALLEAAMDARRLGVGLHLPHAFLIDAAIDYLTDHDYDQLTEDWAEAAFADLALPVHGKQAPLRRATDRPAHRPPGALLSATTSVPHAGSVFRLADYLEQHGRTTRRRLCPPASFWHAANTHLTRPDDLNNLSYAAQRRSRLQWARHLQGRAADAGAPEALVKLALTREMLGDKQEAETLARRAADAGDTSAQLELARKREQAEDQESAETLYRQAADAGNPWALAELARMREEAGDQQGAETLYWQALRGGNELVLHELARIRRIVGDQQSSESFVRQAADAGSGWALAVLARKQEKAGDKDGAEILYRQAADAGDLFASADLARMQGIDVDEQGAEIVAWQAANGANVMILTDMALTREKWGDKQGAETFAWEAVDAGNSFALSELARRREKAGDKDGAEILYRQAADAGELLPIDAARWPHGLEPDGSPTPDVPFTTW